MRSDHGLATRIAGMLVPVALFGASLPMPAAAATAEIQVCGDARPIRLPIRKQPTGHDGSCAFACHATDPRKKRGARC